MEPRRTEDAKPALRVALKSRDLLALYADSEYPVRKDLDEVHAAQFASFSAPGTWGTGAQRLAVVQAALAGGLSDAEYVD